MALPPVNRCWWHSSIYLNALSCHTFFKKPTLASLGMGVKMWSISQNLNGDTPQCCQIPPAIMQRQKTSLINWLMKKAYLQRVEDRGTIETAHRSLQIFENRIHTPWFFISSSIRIDLEPSAHVVINLSASDEQFKNDFSHWLTHYWQAINDQHQKMLFTQADFDYWIEYGVIPYLDLVLIAKIEDKKITQNKMAQLVFPN
jgi:hypothetical protein